MKLQLLSNYMLKGIEKINNGCLLLWKKNGDGWYHEKNAWISSSARSQKQSHLIVNFASHFAWLVAKCSFCKEIKYFSAHKFMQYQNHRKKNQNSQLTILWFCKRILNGFRNAFCWINKNKSCKINKNSTLASSWWLIGHKEKTAEVYLTYQQIFITGV